MASAALEHALFARFGTLGQVEKECLLRSDNGLLFTSLPFTAIVRSYGLKEFITPRCPQQISLVESFVRALKAHCVLRHRFKGINAWCALSVTGLPSTTTAALVRRLQAHSCRGIHFGGLT